VSFSSVEEAVIAGYRPCQICLPSVGRAKERTDGMPFVGNMKSHVFHKVGCRYATCKNCAVGFSTRDDAIAAGYRAGKCCRP